MTVAAAHMFEEMAEEFRRYLDGEGFKSWEVKTRITGIRKLRPHIEQIIKRNMQANLTDVIKEGAEGTRSTLGTSFGLTNDEAVSFASKYTSVLAGEIADNSVETVRKTISEGIAAGRPVKETRKLLEEKFTDWSTARAETVARTETLRASNMGSLEVLNKGGVEYKQFIAASDACGTCLSIHEDVHRIKENFMAKGDKLATATETFSNTYMHMPAPPIHPRCRCTVGGVPGSMVDERTVKTHRVGKRSADTDALMEMFTQVDPAMEFTHMRNPTRSLAISRSAENKTTEIILRRYGDRMSVYLKDSGTILPTPENWAGEVGHLAYGDTYTWLPYAQENGVVSIRHLAEESGSIVSFSGRAYEGFAPPDRLFAWGQSQDPAARIGWAKNIFNITAKYPEPAKLLAKVESHDLGPLKDTVPAQTSWIGNKRAFEFNTIYTETQLNALYEDAYKSNYTMIKNSDNIVQHEYGHVVSGYLQNKGIDTHILASMKEGPISDYATRSPEEYFAETFTAYENGEGLERNDVQVLIRLLKLGGLL